MVEGNWAAFIRWHGYFFFSSFLSFFVIQMTKNICLKNNYLKNLAPRDYILWNAVTSPQTVLNCNSVKRKLYNTTSPILHCIRQLGENIESQRYWVSENSSFNEWVNIVLRRFLHKNGNMGDRKKPEAVTKPWSHLLTSRVLYSAQYTHHCTLHGFQQFGTLHMHNLDDKDPARAWYLQVTSRSRYNWAIGAGHLQMNEKEKYIEQPAGSCMI